MKRDYNYYKNWYLRYKKIWWNIINKKKQNHKTKYLIQEIRYFMWMLEIRMLYHRDYDNPELEKGYPVCLDWKNYKVKEAIIIKSK